MEIYTSFGDSSAFYAGLFMRDQRLIDFGIKVRSLRKAKGLSQEAMANLAGIDRSYMGQIERGEINLTLTKIYQIADALGISPAHLVRNLDDKSSPAN